MNVVIISPHFPKTYWNFSNRLKRNGVNVLGIGDAPYDAISDELKSSLTEYYYLGDLADYDGKRRAVAFFASKYGRIDWIESNNEYWLEQDARLRTDFNVRTGIQADAVGFIKEKSLMKDIYLANDIPTARQHIVSDLSGAKAFIAKTGYPVIAKPNVGVGATHTWKLENDEQLAEFYRNLPDVPYVMEEFVEGDICSYDAVVDSKFNPLFEMMTVWPPSISDIVAKNLDLTYYTCPDVPDKLREYGRKCVKAFGASRRFVHLEFFRLKSARPGLGGVGDFVALEVNMRPAGGYSPDMMNYAHSVDVYQAWADMVVYDELRKTREGELFYCVYASRKDGKTYRHTDSEILDAYGDRLVMREEMPKMNWPQMGRYMYTARVKTKAEVDEFIRFVVG